jgi:hypothetical protein
VIGLPSTIGVVRLGAARAEVERFYGRPVRVARRDGLLTATHRVAGGPLWVRYRDDAVVGIGTSSTYYSTPTGVGPGAELTRAIERLPWDACRRAHRRASGTVAAYFATKPRTRTIANVWLIRRGAEACG